MLIAARVSQDFACCLRADRERTLGFAANLEMRLFTAGYRLNGPSILSVCFGGPSATFAAEAAASAGLAIMFPMSFSRCCFSLIVAKNECQNSCSAEPERARANGNK
jgi:hypothetical protein